MRSSLILSLLSTALALPAPKPDLSPSQAASLATGGPPQRRRPDKHLLLRNRKLPSRQLPREHRIRLLRRGPLQPHAPLGAYTYTPHRANHRRPNQGPRAGTHPRRYRGGDPESQPGAHVRALRIRFPRRHCGGTARADERDHQRRDWRGHQSHRGTCGVGCEDRAGSREYIKRGSEARCVFPAGRAGACPYATPFDTRLSARMVLSFDNQFVVPGSCGDDQPQFTPLKALTQIPEKEGIRWYQASATGVDVPIHFAFDHEEVTLDGGEIFVGWINQANKIAYSDAKVMGGVVQTRIPEGLAGMAFAVLTDQKEALDVEKLTGKTLAGPAPVHIS